MKTLSKSQVHIRRMEIARTMELWIVRICAVILATWAIGKIVIAIGGTTIWVRSL